MRRVDINCDMGESFGRYTLGQDRKMMPFISSANIACGFHAGDPVVMEETVACAHGEGVSIGAHPGFPDLAGFGRRNLAASPREVKAYILYQLGALDGFCRARGARIRHVKPHGALYNMAAADRELAEAICDGVGLFDDRLILLGLSGSQLVECALRKGLRAACEVFADRAYEEDGSLRSRSLPGSLIEEEGEAVSRVVRMVSQGTVQAYSGKDIAIRADSICIHGDGAHALAFAKRVREALEGEGIAIAPLAAG